MSYYLPKGYRFTGVHCGIKNNPEDQDLTLVVSDFPATVAGTYTQNLVFGAAVQVDRPRTPGRGFRAMIANSRCANDCTGERGYRDALEMTALAARVVGVEADKALVMSTGVIGMFMPMEKIAAGVSVAEKQLACDRRSLELAARGILTTDTVEKIASRSFTLSSGETVGLTGFCKGAAMIAPNMRTMLAMLMTDVALSPEDAQALLNAVVDDSFNCISVEGHTSPSDTVLLYANGAACSRELCGEDLETFAENLLLVARELARKIPEDAEGASHLITIDVGGCADRESAKTIAMKVANDPLVKTAIAGADPNWGRIVSAAGTAGVPFDVTGIGLSINGFELYRDGEPVPFDAKIVSESIAADRDTHISLTFTEGTAGIRCWTCDLTCEYVRLNSEYTT